jgi:hypothetical protein
MSDTTTSTRVAPAADAPSNGHGFVKVSGLIVAIIGAIMLVGGAGTWILVQNQLSDEQITVAEDASSNAGKTVNGPFTAYSQAQIIQQHSLELAEGKTYAQLDREDPKRATVMNGSFLRASLFTSVLAFGVSAMAMGLGLVQILLGISMRKLAGARF